MAARSGRAVGRGRRSPDPADELAVADDRLPGLARAAGLGSAWAGADDRADPRWRRQRRAGLDTTARQDVVSVGAHRSPRPSAFGRVQRDRPDAPARARPANGRSGRWDRGPPCHLSLLEPHRRSIGRPATGGACGSTGIRGRHQHPRPISVGALGRSERRSWTPCSRNPTTYTLHLPLSVTLHQVLPRGNRFVFFLACSPITAWRCRSFIWNAPDLPARARGRRRARRVPGHDLRPGPPDRRVPPARGAAGRPIGRAAHRGPGPGLDRLPASAGRARREPAVARCHSRPRLQPRRCARARVRPDG